MKEIILVIMLCAFLGFDMIAEGRPREGGDDDELINYSMPK